MIYNFGLVMNNISYTKKVCYNISIIDLTETNRIEEFKAKIINLTDNYNYYRIEEFEYYNYEKTLEL